jgi:DNA topoisomerase-1
MQVAQRLFQGVDIGGGDLEGLISYHRTDSTTLSDKALTDAGRAVTEMYGESYYKGPRQYQTKVRNAQEAHEAIRPTDFRRTPQTLEGALESDELRVYELIWKRATASQMAEARMLRTTAEITGSNAAGAPCVFSASGKAIEFAGYLRAYVEGSDDPSAELDEQETLLPKLNVGELVHAPDQVEARVIVVGVDPKGHETTPPPRYTEASLVKRLEEEGIGRPSTYAPTVATIQRRGYVTRQGKALVPSFNGLRGDAPAAGPLRRLCRHRLHRRDGRDPRPDLQRRQALAGFHSRVLPGRREAPRAGAPGRGPRPGDQLPGR